MTCDDRPRDSVIDAGLDRAVGVRRRASRGSARDLDQRQQGRVVVQGRAIRRKPGKMAPPRKRAGGVDEIDRDRRAGIDDDRRRAPAGRAVLAATAFEQPVDADLVRRIDLHVERQLRWLSNQARRPANPCSASQA